MGFQCRHTFERRKWGAVPLICTTLHVLTPAPGALLPISTLGQVQGMWAADYVLLMPGARDAKRVAFAYGVTAYFVHLDQTYDIAGGPAGNTEAYVLKAHGSLSSAFTQPCPWLPGGLPSDGSLD